MNFSPSIRERVERIHARLGCALSAPLWRNITTGDYPLLLVVESAADKQQGLIQLLTTLHYTVFMVEDHTQAMAWAPLLPFSALLMNHSLPDARSIVIKLLKNLVEENLMADIPIWLMADSLTAKEEQNWREAGVAMFLTQPLRHATLASLGATMLPPDAFFYTACDTLLQSDFPPSILQRMPELNCEVGKQMRQLQGMLRALPNAADPARVGEHAHAVKSATLSLGYYRLAALAAEIEHALVNKTFDTMLHHWQIIADRLDPLVFEQAQTVLP